MWVGEKDDAFDPLGFTEFRTEKQKRRKRISMDYTE